MPGAVGKTALMLGAATLSRLAIVEFDRALGVVVPTRWVLQGLLFPPSVRVAMRTPNLRAPQLQACLRRRKYRSISSHEIVAAAKVDAKRTTATSTGPDARVAGVKAKNIGQCQR